MLSILINTSFLALCRVNQALHFVSLQRKEDIPDMDQVKIGLFLKELRKSSDLTQEQLAEHLNVSARTVSRWETGNNMPDLSVLVEIADFYDVDIREIINGERKSEKMNDELKDTLKHVAEYGEEEKKKLKKKMIDISIGSVVILLFAMLLDCTGGFGFVSEHSCQNVMDFALGLVLAILILNVLYLSGVLDKIKTWKISSFSKKSNE